MTGLPGPARSPQRGLTLIELVVAITIIAIAAAAVLGAMSAITSRGADAMIRQQEIAIAQSYLEEILLQPVVAPAGAPAPTGRGSFDDVDQYAGLVDSGAHDQFGNPIPGLSAYTVSVAVNPTSALSGIASTDARRIDVTVSNPAVAGAVLLTGYRTNF